MRVVGGRLRGRSLKAPLTRAIRPTADRLRESLFDILAHRHGRPREDERVLDLFAGSGALAIEALSRGAGFALLIDQGMEACALIEANLAALALGGVARLLRRDARRLGPAPAAERFSLIFLDPPYGQGFAAPALEGLLRGGWLTPDALIVIEESAAAAPVLPPSLISLDLRRFGDTAVTFAALAEPAPG